MADPMIIVCPGQGAQAVGMGKVWAETSPEAQAVFDEADDVGNVLGALPPAEEEGAFTKRATSSRSVGKAQRCVSMMSFNTAGHNAAISASVVPMSTAFTSSASMSNSNVAGAKEQWWGTCSHVVAQVRLPSAAQRIGPQQAYLALSSL